ncbi:MAG: ligase-associated DNA damage response endonuclease PdeM [Saprospiraceae bacterium]
MYLRPGLPSRQVQVIEEFILHGQRFHLYPSRAIHWTDRNILLLADLHLGKGAHFRGAGIPVPRAVELENFSRLHQLLRQTRPERVLLLGDLFHSDYNHIWDDFIALIAAYPTISFELVPGNHDILPDADYQRSGLVMLPEIYDLGPFRFTHHPQEEGSVPADLYNLCGHLHPGVHLAGGGGETMRLPCFFFGARQGILPAFGEFTGCAYLSVRAGDRVFVLTPEAVIDVVE